LALSHLSINYWIVEINEGWQISEHKKRRDEKEFKRACIGENTEIAEMAV